MIPEYLTTTEAQRLLDRGRARLDGPECLITKRAVYHWQPETQRYARDNAPPVAQVDPTPVARNRAMDDQPVTSEPHPASPEAARIALHQLIDRMTDEEAVAMWRLICSWVAEGTRERPAQWEGEEQP